MKRRLIKIIPIICIPLLLITKNGSGSEGVDKSGDKVRMQVQSGHTEWVNKIIWNPDGMTFASCSNDHTARIWSSDGCLLNELVGHSDFIYQLSWSHDGKILASGSNDHTVRLWKYDGMLVSVIEGYSRSFSWSPVDKELAISMNDNTIRLMNADGELKKILKGHKNIVESLVWSPDGKILASGSWDNTIRLWYLNEQNSKILAVHKKEVSILAWSSDGKTIASGSKDGTVCLWNSDGSLLKIIDGTNNIEPFISWSNHSNMLAIGSSKNTIIIIINKSGKLLKEINNTGYIRCLSWSPDDKLFAVSSGIIISLLHLEGQLCQTLAGHDQIVNSFSWKPDGRVLASASSDKSICLWDSDGRLLKKIGGGSLVKSISWDTKGEILASGSFNNDIFFWDSTGRLLKILSGHKSNIYSLSWSPDGEILASGSSDKTIRLWNRAGSLIKTIYGHSDLVTDLSWRPDGRILASASQDKTICLWTRDGSLIKKNIIRNSVATALGWSPDGNLLAVGFFNNFDKQVCFLNNEGVLVKTITGMKYFVLSFSWSPDGQVLALGLSGPDIYLWNREGELIQTLKGHNKWVRSICWSPDGKMLASGSDDKMLKLWDREGHLLRTFGGHKNKITSLAWRPDMKILASASGDSTIRLWKIDSGDSVALLPLGSGNWSQHTDDGFWDGSKNGGKYINMIKCLSAFGVDQFAIRNNRPDIILERMGLGTPELIEHYRNQYKKRARKIEKLYGIKESDLSGELHVPEAKIIENKPEGKFVTLKFSLSDSKYDLRAYNVYVNDVPLYGSLGKRISGKNLTINERIELSYSSSGENKIEVSCFNEKGAESYRALDYASYKPATQVKPDLYFIGFGVSQYKNEKFNLKYAHKDVTDMADVFAKMKGKGFADVKTAAFTDEKVTPENIRRAKDILKDATVDDTVVLFISGHGMHERNAEANYYFLTHGADTENMEETAVNFELVEDLLQGIAPRNKLFLMDTCESGEIDDEGQARSLMFASSGKGVTARAARGVEVIDKSGSRKARTYLYDRDRYIYNDIFRRSGAIVFSSSKGGEYSYEDDSIRNGYFSREIMNALTSKKADKNNDGMVSIDELRDYVSKSVSDDTKGCQHPTVDRDNIYQKFGFPVVD